MAGRSTSDERKPSKSLTGKLILLYVAMGALFSIERRPYFWSACATSGTPTYMLAVKAQGSVPRAHLRAVIRARVSE